MSLSVLSLDTLDPTKVQEQIDTITELLQDLNPDLDLKRGVLHDLLLYLEGVLAAATQTNIELLRKSNSLQAVVEDPTLADEDTLDLLASNYRITRKAGVAATGSIALICDALQTTVVPFGAEFTANGVTFTTTAVFVGRTTEDEVILSTDREITTSASGAYSFIVDVVAATTGTDGNLTLGTELELSQVITNVNSAYVTTALTGGRDEETNAELADRLSSGVASRTLTNRLAIDGLLRSQEDFSEILQTSVIGYGDTEQRRYHSVLPVAFGGRIDVYVRTAELPEEVVIPVTATLQSKTIDFRGVWSFTLDRDTSQGMYKILRVTQSGDGLTASGYALDSDTRSYDVTVNTGDDMTNSTTFIPDITSANEAAYSRYSNGTFTFTDTDTDTTPLNISDTRDYDAVVVRMPLILDIQDFVAGRDVRNTSSDCLVRAPVPCFMTVTVNINVKRNTTAPDEDDVRVAVANYVNRSGFPGSISAAAIASQVHAVIPTTSSVSTISMTGSLLKTNNATVSLSSSTVLSFSNDYDHFTSTRTVAFILDSDDITVNLATVDVP